jgi:hypothetical protein
VLSADSEKSAPFLRSRLDQRDQLRAGSRRARAQLNAFEELSLLFTGMTIYLAGVPYRRRAEEEGERAVWWNNAALSARPKRGTYWVLRPIQL